MTPTREQMAVCADFLQKEGEAHMRGNVRDRRTVGVFMMEGGTIINALAAENAALREQLEATEKHKDLGWDQQRYWCDRYDKKTSALEAALTEARAQVAAAWMAGYQAQIDHYWSGAKAEWYGDKAPVPPHAPTDATAALTAVRDAEWEAAIEAAAGMFEDEATRVKHRFSEGGYGHVSAKEVQNIIARLRSDASRIRALRRVPKEGV